MPFSHGGVSILSSSSTINLSGTLALPSNLATETTLVALYDKFPSALATDRLKVDGSGVTQPISGAVFDTLVQSKLTGIGAQLPSALASDRLKVDGSGVAQPVSDNGGSLTVDGTVGVSGTVTVADGGGSLTVDATSLPLPTGAATDATLLVLSTSITTTNLKLSEFQKTAFNELLVAQLYPKAGWTFAYGVNLRHVVSTQTGGAPAITVSNARAKVTVDGPNQTNVLETRKALRYVPGIGGLCRITCVFNAPNANLFQLAGLGDTLDGLFLMYSGSSFGFARKNNASLTFISQSDWNLDKFNGTGATGANFNPLFGHPISFRFQWLGYGAQLLELEDPVTGLLKPAHIIQYAGTAIDVSLRNPNLPCHVEMTTNASYTAGVSSSLYSPSAMAFQEGNENGVLAADWVNTGVVNAGATEIPVISLQNPTTFNGISNKIRAEVTQISVCATVNSNAPRSVSVRIYRDSITNMLAALTGESFVTARAGEACCFYDISSTAFTPPVTAYQVYESRNIVPESKFITLEQQISLTPNECLVVTAQRSTGTGSADVEVTLYWKEPI